MQILPEINYNLSVSQKELRLIGRALAIKLKPEDAEEADRLNQALLKQLIAAQEQALEQTKHALTIAEGTRR